MIYTLTFYQQEKAMNTHGIRWSVCAWNDSIATTYIPLTVRVGYLVAHTTNYESIIVEAVMIMVNIEESDINSVGL